MTIAAPRDWRIEIVASTGIASPDTGFTPQLPVIVGFGTAFAFGWLLHRQSELVSAWRQRWAMHLALAVVFTAVSLLTVESASVPLAAALRLAYAVCYTLAMWHWIFGLIGTALRFCSGESPIRRYIADSSYWLYLAHLPVVFALQLTVLTWPLHWSIKFPFIVSLAVALLLVTYHYCVRGTYVGEVLNGRRYAPARSTTSSLTPYAREPEPTGAAE